MIQIATLYRLLSFSISRRRVDQILTCAFALVCIAGSCTTVAAAQSNNDLEARLISNGAWSIAFKVPSKPFVTNGYDVFFDNRIIIKLEDGVFATNLARGAAAPAFWDQSFAAGTYKVDCRKAEFYFIGYKFADGTWIEGRAGKVWKFNKQNQPFFANFCSQAPSLIAANEAAYRAANPPPEPVKQSDVASVSSPPTNQTRGAPKSAQNPKPAPAKVVTAPKNVRVYSAGGLTVTCYTEQGRSICR